MVASPQSEPENWHHAKIRRWVDTHVSNPDARKQLNKVLDAAYAASTRGPVTGEQRTALLDALLEIQT